jgi:tRNA G37 N-methylase TrmD
MKRAIDKGLVEVHFHNLRDYTTNKKVLTITNTAVRNGYDRTAY